ncbi:MerR family transcriptional regulator, partial [Paenibacillus tengchongensis]|uniref:MerR family transcriptional regulator n=1 Tax=Paenibacillus tengchongensis TaxID=2608684 RepID=UPI00124E7C6C
MDGKWGYFEITLEGIMRSRGFDSRRLAQAAHFQQQQLKQYIAGKVTRPDLNVLARVCAVLGCGIGDVLKYVPPQIKWEPKVNEAERYTTGELSKIAEVPPNTVRFYEKVGLISPVERAQNGYRQFTPLHLLQLRICRLIFKEPYAGKRLRNSSLTVLQALKERNLPKASGCAEAHLRTVEQEYAAALETASLLKQWTERRELPQSGQRFNRKEAASMLGVTAEVVRNWERNGLITVPRAGSGHRRVYGDDEIARLRLIYMLRQNHYSIAAIRRSLARF